MLPPFPARHLLGVSPSGLASPIHARLVLLCLLCCSHNHSSTSIVISRPFYRHPSSLHTYTVSSSSISRCLVHQASYHKSTHVCSPIVYSFALKIANGAQSYSLSVLTDPIPTPHDPRLQHASCPVSVVQALHYQFTHGWVLIFLLFG